MRRLLKIAIPILFTAVAAPVAIGAPRKAVIPDQRDEIRVEIAKTPEKSGGIYYAYPVVSDSLPPVPEGFTPVYISHYGRHGSRWAINPKIYNESIEGMRKAEESGNLTETGKEVLATIERCKANADGHLGELTLLGGKQHRGIAKRLYQRFPDVFKQGKIKARSSEVPRCVVSMANFTNSLISQDPSLDIDLYSGPGDMEILALTIPEKDKHKFNNKKEDVRRKIYKEKRDSLTRSIEAASKIFKNPEKVENLPALMRDIYDVAIAVQNVEGLNENLFTLFPEDELYNLWKSGNFGQYMDYGNTASSWGSGPDSALPLLRDIVARADSSLAGKGVPVDLRFGHDTVLMRLLALLRAKDCYADTDDLEVAAEKWQNYKMSPMGANFQMIFFRNDEGKVIVTLRLNEQPLILDGIPELYPGYYDYTVLSEILKSRLHPVSALVERVSPGRSDDFIFVETPGDKDFFEIDSKDGKVMITGNNPVNIAAGLNWYLKYYAGVHLSWKNMRAELPATLPLPAQKEVCATDLSQRYYLNYCTHSYSMAFWDLERWQQEIDWMALHGINMPLAITGTDAVWRNTLLRLGYSEKEADEFVAGPAFQAWWLMNNLEGWGGPNSEKWYADRVRLQKDILEAMEEYGMTPVLPGYSGMLPHDAAERLGVEATGTGLWNGFIRPAFLKTTDPMFDKIADIYYEELAKVSGTSKYYSMDPFHEGEIAEGVDLGEAGGIILNAMKRVNPDAVWVIQGWNENPRAELLDGIKRGDIVVLDLASEIKPNWGDPESPSLTKRENGYDPHDWMYCMLLNFGGNVGLHGRMDNVIEGFYKARDSKYADTLTGLGLTPEGIENNPVMYELATELLWRPKKFEKSEWLKDYTKARYGKTDKNVEKAWDILSNTIYNCPWGNMQQGTTESVFCARPSDDVWQVSSWSRMAPYYEPEDVIRAAKTFAKGAGKLSDNANYRYDLVDITRQAIAEKGRLTYTKMRDALKRDDKPAFERYSNQFLDLLKAQERLLSSLPEFSVNTWLESAVNIAPEESDKDNMERNARLLITTWGPRVASEDGGLRDYAHREWGGLLGDLYLKRWTRWIDSMKDGDRSPIDFYEIDENWVNSRDRYETGDGSESVDISLSLIKQYL